MLNIHQLSDAISQVQPDHPSIEQFERWLRIESRNVHSWGSEDVIDAVLGVEAVLSSYHFDELDPLVVREELANAVRPFARLFDCLIPGSDHEGLRKGTARSSSHATGKVVDGMQARNLGYLSSAGPSQPPVSFAA